MRLQIHLQLMNRHPDLLELMQPYLVEFETQTRIHVRLEILQWENAREALNRYGFTHQGPDVSEVGSTWIGDLAAMEVLRPFRPVELNQMGGIEGFVLPTWMSCHLPGDDRAWGVPWISEAFVIHYRRDWLQRAGVDPAAAFASPQAIVQTAAALRASGVDVPAALPLAYDNYGNLHSLASFVWAEGAEFLSPDGKQVQINQPAARRAVETYFGLLNQASPAGLQALYDHGGRELFRRGQAGFAFSSQSLALYPENADFPPPPDLLENWEVAPFPPASFVGGSGLITWNHTRHAAAALELTRYLASEPVQERLAQQLNGLPARISALHAVAASGSPLVQKLAGILENNGRSYPPAPLWGTVEDRLVAALQVLWADYYAAVSAGQPFDIAAASQQTFDLLARRLNLTLSQYNPRRAA